MLLVPQIPNYAALHFSKRGGLQLHSNACNIYMQMHVIRKEDIYKMENISKTINPRIRATITVILLLSTFVSLASQTMMLTALPVIQKEMHVSLTLVQWLTTGYTLIIGVVTPLSSNMYEKFRNRSVFLGTIGTFIAGTIIGCFATNFWTLLLARLVQACAGGILMSFQMTTMVSIYPMEKRGTIMGMSGLVIAFGPAIGPTLSGLIVNTLGWRYIFILVLPLMVLVFLVGLATFPNFKEPRDLKIDILSVLLSLSGAALTLASLTFFQTSVAQGAAMLVIGLFILTMFVRRQLKLEEPMLKVRIIGNPTFRRMTIVGIFAFMILLGTEQMIPLFAQNESHVSSTVSGMIMLPGAIANAFSAAIVGRLYDRFGPKYLVTTGGILMIVASLPLVMLKPDTPLWIVTVAYMLRMIGNALVFSPAMSESFIELDQSEISHATALNNSIRQAFGATSITIMIVVSGIPSSFVTGFHAAMWVTVLFAVLLLTTFGIYWRHSPRKNA